MKDLEIIRRLYYRKGLSLSEIERRTGFTRKTEGRLAALGRVDTEKTWARKRAHGRHGVEVEANPQGQLTPNSLAPPASGRHTGFPEMRREFVPPC